MRQYGQTTTTNNVFVILSMALYVGMTIGTQRTLPPHMHRILSMAIGTACLGLLAKVGHLSGKRKVSHISVFFVLALIFIVVRTSLWNTVDASKTAMVRIDRGAYTTILLVVLLESMMLLFPGTPMHVVILALLLLVLYPVIDSLVVMLFWNERTDAHVRRLAAKWSYDAYDKGTIRDDATGTKCGVAVHEETNTIIVYFAGTDDTKDMKQNISIGDVQWACRDGQRYGRVHRGFMNAYASVRDRLHTALAAAMATVTSPTTTTTVIITGHSLGGALAVLAAADLTCQTDDDTLRTRIKVVTFGAPPLCDDVFARSYAVNGPSTTWRFVNPWDYVPRLPGMQFVHVGKPIMVTSPNPLDNTPTPLAHSMNAYTRAVSKSRWQHILGLLSPSVYIVIAMLAVHIFKSIKSS
jgi:hypothetical protein